MPLQLELPSAHERNTIRRRPLSISVGSMVPMPVLMCRDATVRALLCTKLCKFAVRSGALTCRAVPSKVEGGGSKTDELAAKLVAAPPH